MLISSISRLGSSTIADLFRSFSLVAALLYCSMIQSLANAVMFVIGNVWE